MSQYYYNFIISLLLLSLWILYNIWIVVVLGVIIIHFIAERDQQQVGTVGSTVNGLSWAMALKLEGCCGSNWMAHHWLSVIDLIGMKLTYHNNSGSVCSKCEWVHKNLAHTLISQLAACMKNSALSAVVPVIEQNSTTLSCCCGSMTAQK